jgi:hypothetical protein
MYPMVYSGHVLYPKLAIVFVDLWNVNENEWMNEHWLLSLHKGVVQLMEMYCWNMYLTTSNKIHSLAVLTILNVPLWLGEKSNATSTAGSFLFGMWCYVVWWKCVSVSEDLAVFIIRGDELTNPDDNGRKLVQNVCILLHEYILSHLRRKQFS